jgi:hypothetical protein
MGERSATHRLLMPRLGTRPNPVQHELVVAVANWPYSSSHRSVAMGINPADGARTEAALNEAWGALKGER